MRILIAEDDPISNRVLQVTLKKWGYEVISTCDGDEAWQVLQSSDAPNLAIVDWMMPKMDGAELCRRVRGIQGSGRAYTYLILLTARGQKEDVIEGMDAGADDYITKPFDAGELRVRLHAAKRVLELEAGLLEAQEALRHDAMYDHLTKLLNRAAVLDVLDKEIAKANREETSVSVLMADLDRFKQVNDTYGHDAGDHVLREASRVFKENLRQYDAVGRYGGEEFLIVLPGCNLMDAAARADMLRKQLKDTPIRVGNETILQTVCLGVAASSSDPIGGAEELIRAADAAMYVAKRAGRDRIEIAKERVCK